MLFNSNCIVTSGVAVVCVGVQGTMVHDLQGPTEKDSLTSSRNRIVRWAIVYFSFCCLSLNNDVTSAHNYILGFRSALGLLL